MWTIYFLKSIRKDWYYVGSTNNLSRRILEHNKGRVSSTKSHVPLKLVYKQDCNNEKEARFLEKRIKSQRLLKEQIIRTINT